MQHPIESINSWKNKSFMEQLANIGSEVFRTLSSKDNGRKQDSLLAFYRSLELIDITLDCNLRKSEFSELCRFREFWIDYFLFNNQYNFTKEYWESYFYQISYAYALSK